MDHLILNDWWKSLSRDDLRRFAGITGQIHDPEAEMVVARAVGGGRCQVFIVDKAWDVHGVHNPLGMMLGASSARGTLREAALEAMSDYHDYKVRHGEWPETRGIGKDLPRELWPVRKERANV